MESPAISRPVHLTAWYYRFSRFEFLLIVMGIVSAIVLYFYLSSLSPSAALPTYVERDVKVTPRAVSAGGIPASVYPPNGFQDVTCSKIGCDDTAGWKILDVTKLGLPANRPDLDAGPLAQKIVDSSDGPRILYFPPGTYYFKSSLKIRSSQFHIRGEGQGFSGRSVFEISGEAEVTWHGSWNGNPYALTSDARSGDASISIKGNDISVGTYLMLYNNNGASNFGQPTEAQTVQVTSKSGDRLGLDMKIGLNYPISRGAMVKKINMVTQAGIERIRFRRTTRPNGAAINNIGMYFVANSFVRDVISAKAGRCHAFASNSKNIIYERNYFHDFWVNDYSYAYGIQLVYGTSTCRITDNKFWQVRHAVVLSLGANHVIVSYNSIEEPLGGPTSYNDIALHADFGYMNLFEGNHFREGYADNSKGDGHPAGPGNFWFRNWVGNKVGSISQTTQKQVVIGNLIGNSVATAGTGHFIAANRVHGEEQWGPLNSGAVPNSAYLPSKPAFLEMRGKPWPMYGPGVGDWGSGNSLPAADRGRVGY